MTYIQGCCKICFISYWSTTCKRSSCIFVFYVVVIKPNFQSIMNSQKLVHILYYEIMKIINLTFNIFNASWRSSC